MNDDLVLWEITMPIKGEATTSFFLKKGSTKYDALRCAHEGTDPQTGKSLVWDETWGIEEDPRSGDFAIASGPNCHGEEVDLDDEGQEEDE